MAGESRNPEASRSPSYFKKATKARKDRKKRSWKQKSIRDSEEEGGGSVRTQPSLTFFLGLPTACAPSLPSFLAPTIRVTIAL